MKRLRHPWLGLMSVVIIFFVAGCVGGNSGKVYAQDRVNDSQLFKLKDLHGQEISLADLLKKNKAVLVNFWATWCPPCREEIPGLISLQQKYGGPSFTIVGVDIGESEKKVSSFASRIGINYPVALDDSQSVAESYRVVGIPTSFLINSEGKIVGEYHEYSRELVDDIEKAVR